MESPMALTSSNIESGTEAASGANPEPTTSGPGVRSLLVSLTSLPPEALEATLTNLALAFPESTVHGKVLVATPDTGHPMLTGASFGSLRLLPYTAVATSINTLFLSTADYLNTFRMVQDHQAGACLLLGTQSQSLSPETIRALAAPVVSASIDLAVPHYRLGPRDGLVNSAILYPVTRALYGARTRFPLAIDLGLSARMAERLAAAAQSFNTSGQGDAILWPVAEAAAANWTISEVEAGARMLPHPSSIDLNALLTQIAGSLFADINAKASVWQRVRIVQPGRPISMDASPADGWPDVTPMLEAFRLAYTNLAEIWALVLPPNTLLGLKHLSLLPPASFRMSDALWTRIVYDFILAYRLHTINRGHLLGALTPLYLAWVASHIILASGGTPPEQHIEELAATFENDKAYLVSRWRWPDRFNP
jgi:glucosylglycerate synthase